MTQVFVNNVCGLIMVIMVGKSSEQTNLGQCIQKNRPKVVYIMMGDYWLVVCIQHHLSPATR